MAEYTKSVVSYFDILGFRKLVETASSPEDVARRLRELQRFSSPDQDVATIYGNTFNNFSDLVLRTVPIEPTRVNREAGLLYGEILDLLHIQAELIVKGVLVRGALTVGDIFVNEKIVFGPALIRAYELEHSVAASPRVIIDPLVFTLLEDSRTLRSGSLEDELQYLCRVLKKDTDGVWFVDYLRAFESEADNPAAYLRFLRAHQRLITQELYRLPKLDSVATKYGWLLEYHNAWVNSMSDAGLKELGASKKELLVPDSATKLFRSIEEDPLANL